jgi:hypothetical protein
MTDGFLETHAPPLSSALELLHCKKTKLFPSRESLVNDFPAGDGETANLFYSVYKEKTSPYTEGRDPSEV